MAHSFIPVVPTILTDDLYIDYGGRTGTATAAQRSAAYSIAESQMIQHLETPLIPSMVTGIIDWRPFMPARIKLPHNYVHSIEGVTIKTRNQTWYSCNITDEDGCSFLIDDTFGIIDIHQITATCQCFTSVGLPFQAHIAYNAGLPTGVSSVDSRLHLALTISAELNLLEIIDPAALEGGPGDPGINEYVNMGYGEKRVALRRTTFGNSARANKAMDLVAHLYKKFGAKMGL